jgi:putative ABC transport system substrate-binding protein
VRLAAQHGLPTVYPYGTFARLGGLVSYGMDVPYLFRQAAVYADRILRGAHPGDLPVQQPSKFELVVNVQTARSLGLTIPGALPARADEVIE